MHDFITNLVFFCVVFPYSPLEVLVDSKTKCCDILKFRFNLFHVNNLTLIVLTLVHVG